MITSIIAAITMLLATFAPAAHADVERDASAGEVRATELRCEMRERPLGLDTPNPRLSWQLMSDVNGQRQTAYQVLVAERPGDLRPGSTSLWDSGRVESDRSLHIVYDGEPLQSRQQCWWTVRVWDRHGRVSDWSMPSTWEMGFLNPGDWTARWISDGRPTPTTDEAHYDIDPAPMMRRVFNVDGDVSGARLHIAGLGYFDAAINGTPVTDTVLNPIWTAVDKRVFSSVFDVTDSLMPGANAIGVMLGNGWYNPLPLRMWGHVNLRERLVIGRPRLIAQLEIDYADGRRQVITTDETWKTSPGPILRNNIYLGEEYDARLEQPGWSEPDFDDAAWKPVVLATSTLGPLQSQPLQPIRVIGRLRPIGITEPEPGVYIVDMGRNFTGWARLHVNGPRGTRIRMRFGELLDDDGRLNPMTSVCGQIKRAGVGGPGAPDVAVQEDHYTLRGDGPEMYTPRFTFHAFRYVELTGLPEAPDLNTIEGLQLACDVDEIGHFECSNDLFNRIHAMVRWTFLSNIIGVQSDCPHRERFGYGGDIVATCDAFMMNLDMSCFYPKTVVDFLDSTPDSGAFPMTAPGVGIAYAGLEDGDSPIGWSLAHPLLVRELFRYHGNERIIAEHYDAACAWIEYLRAHAINGIIDQGLSDHETLEPKAVPVTSTAFYLQAVESVEVMARVLGRTNDADQYALLASEIRAAFARELIDVEAGTIGNGSQAAQAAAFFFDLVPENTHAAAWARLVLPLEADPSALRTGIFGTRYLLEVLSRHGRDDLAFAVVDRTSFPGWGHMIERGATTLWEHWEFSDNTFSHNHPMFGSVSSWMHQWVLGIAPAPDAVGFDHVLIRPGCVGELNSARGRYDSVRGPITCSWDVTDGVFTLRVSLPPGVRGTVTLPQNADNAAVRFGRSQHVEQLRPSMFTIESGSYEFTAPMVESD